MEKVVGLPSSDINLRDRWGLKPPLELICRKANTPMSISFWNIKTMI
jgi:hypothetical protein